MSKLVLQGKNGSTKEFPLDRERVTIGHKAHNEVHLDGSAVSGNHAVIITLGGDSFLEDLNSTNGTWVNQKSVRKCVLNDGDEIRIAGYKFIYVSEMAVQNAPGRMLFTTPNPQVSLSVNQSATKEMPIPAPHAESSPDSATLGVIRILAGAGSGQALELVRAVTTLGKPGIQVAAITRRDGCYYLGLVEGADLLLVNGTPVDALPCLLKHHDVINIAGTQLEFVLK